MGIITSLMLVHETIKHATGGYIQVEATVTYAHHFEGWSRRSGYYDRANGYVTWEHKGMVFESDRLIDLPDDVEKGGRLCR